jgi:glycosyltransferase involved in cell wall biosynthesis
MVVEAEVAQRLGESAIFLSLSRLEGVGLPPLEAMASGCLVVGFTGGGGAEFARDDNGFWCSPDDLVGAADALARAVAVFEGDSAGYEVRRDAGMRTASQYNLGRLERELLAFWRDEVAL